MPTNTLLTADQITREALRVLHQKLTFIGSINRAYDDSFANDGAKIGSTIRIRKPIEYTVRTGPTLSAQDVTETNTTLTVDTQKGVDFSFSSKELTMSIDEFSDRHLKPAMSRLAAEIESLVWAQMYKTVPNLVDNDGAAISLYNVLYGRKLLNDALAPLSDRSALLSTLHAAKLTDALKTLTEDRKALSEQYREGVMTRTAGFDFMESSHVTDHTTGTAVEGDTLYNVNGATEDGDTITVNTGATTFLVGDVVTFAGCYAVHPETKANLGYLKQFVITANSGANATSLSISPAIVVSGARQNVSGYPTNGGAVTKVGAGASELLNSSMVYHKDAFTFATADLVLPRGVDMASRQVFDGISMRMVRQYTISDDQFPVRFDVLYGAAALRPEHAVRIHADG